MSEPTPAANPSSARELPGAVVPYERTLDGVLGVQVVEATAERVVARTQIDDRHRQPYGLVHGGVYALIGESTASIGGAINAAERGEIAMGSSNNTAFVRPFVGDGVLTSVATPLHRGRTTQLWDVEHRDGQERLVATSRVTIATRKPRD